MKIKFVLNKKNLRKTTEPAYNFCGGKITIIYLITILCHSRIRFHNVNV